MKKTIENIIVSAILLLFLLVIILVVRYIMIEDNRNDILVTVPKGSTDLAQKAPSTKEYLKEMEGYSDVDVKVDPTKDNRKNLVKVKTEEKNNKIENALETDEKKRYVKDLETYNDTQHAETKTETLEDTTPEENGNGDTIAKDLESIIGE